MADSSERFFEGAESHLNLPLRGYKCLERRKWTEQGIHNP